MTTSVRIGDIIDNFDSMRVPVSSSKRRPGQYPYYGASGIVDHVEDFIFDGPYLLIAEDGENLKTRSTPIAIPADGKFWVNNHSHVVRGKPGLCSTTFLGYYFATIDISGYLSGSAQPKLSQTSLNSIRINLPSLPEQKAIAEVLGALDDKIAANRKLVTTTEDLMVALVTNLEADASLKQLADLRRSSVQPDAMPTLVNHYSLPRYDEGAIPCRELSATIKSGKFHFDHPAVLLSKLNPRFPRIWNVPHPEENSIASTEFLVLEPRRISSSTLWALLSTRRVSSFLQERVSGTTGSHQRFKPAQAMEMPMPSSVPENLQDALTSLGVRAVAARQESQTLASLRDALLPALMDGTIRVKDAEKQAEEVL